MAPLQLDLGILIILKGCRNCQLSTVNCKFGEAAKQQFLLPDDLGFLYYTPEWDDCQSIYFPRGTPGRACAMGIAGV